MEKPPRKAYIVGISGASCSGKTTLARLLRNVFPNTFILHQDDFFKDENELPLKNGFKDGDCAESIKIPELASALAYITSNGTYPPGHDSAEGLSPSLSGTNISESTLSTTKTKISQWLAPGHPGDSICGLSASDISSRPSVFILEGILLYPTSVKPLHHFLDVKLFLQSNYATIKARRESRDAYVTIDGVWVDPPGYFDGIVWENYKEEHSWMFDNGDVDGSLKKDVLKDSGIEALGESDGNMDKIFTWAVDAVMRGLERLISE